MKSEKSCNVRFSCKERSPISKLAKLEVTCGKRALLESERVLAMSKRRNNSDDDLSSFLPSFVKKPKIDGENDLPINFGKQSGGIDSRYAIDKTMKKKVSRCRIISHSGGDKR